MRAASRWTTTRQVAMSALGLAALALTLLQSAPGLAAGQLATPDTAPAPDSLQAWASWLLTEPAPPVDHGPNLFIDGAGRGIDAATGRRLTIAQWRDVRGERFDYQRPSFPELHRMTPDEARAQGLVVTGDAPAR